MKVEPEPRFQFRPVDLAREAGIGPQMVRRYEAWGFLPPAARTASGHRRFGSRHLDAIRTARVMIAGYGWQHALTVMQAVHRGDLPAALAAVDARHADLDRRRREIEETLGALRVAATGLAEEPVRRDHAGRDVPLRVGEAADRVGVRVSALRFWEAQGLLAPARDPSSRYRVYDGAQLRRLRVVVLLRQAGYGFDAIRAVLDELAAGRPARALAAAEARLHELTEASRRCAEATAALWGYVERYEEGVFDSARDGP